MREHHIKWITNAKVDRFEAGKVFVSEMAEDGSLKQAHDVPFAFSMMLPAFRGVEAVRGIEGLTNHRGFILADKYQRNPAFATSSRSEYASRSPHSARRRCRWACPRPAS